MKTVTENVFIADIDFDYSPCVRANLDEAAIEDYAESYKRNEKLPPPDLFREGDSKSFLVADGRHRVKAAEKANFKLLQCNVHEGDIEACVEFALGANREHKGVRRTNADKRVCAEQGLKTFPKWSNMKLALVSGVSEFLIRESRKSLEFNAEIIPQVVRETVSGGKKNVTNIGLNKKSKSKNPKNQEDKTSHATTLDTKTIKDECGMEIPKGVLVFWERRGELRELMEEISRIKCRFERIDGSDPLYAEFHANEHISALKNMYSNISSQIPYAVCTACQGHPEKNVGKMCEFCYGTGLISKHKWENMASVDKKAMRMKVIAQTEARA